MGDNRISMARTTRRLQREFRKWVSSGYRDIVAHEARPAARERWQQAKALARSTATTRVA